MCFISWFTLTKNNTNLKGISRRWWLLGSNFKLKKTNIMTMLRRNLSGFYHIDNPLFLSIWPNFIPTELEMGFATFGFWPAVGIFKILLFNHVVPWLCFPQLETLPSILMHLQYLGLNRALKGLAYSLLLKIHALYL